MISTEKQRNEIQEFLQNELTKRGFHTPIIRFEERKGKFEFVTERFQTNPVIFKSLQIGTFGSYIDSEEEEINLPKIFSFSITVQSFWEVFSGGSNSTKLFTIFGKFVEGEDRVYGMTIR